MNIKLNSTTKVLRVDKYHSILIQGSNFCLISYSHKSDEKYYFYVNGSIHLFWNKEMLPKIIGTLKYSSNYKLFNILNKSVLLEYQPNSNSMYFADKKLYKRIFPKYWKFKYELKTK